MNQHRLLGAALCLSVAITLAACSPSARTTTFAPPPAAASATNSQATSTIGAPMTASTDAPATYEDAEKSADALLLAPQEVPGGGWGKGGPVDSDDFRQLVCGVDTEPNPPAGAFIARRVQPSGLTLYQTIRPVGLVQARSTVQALRAALGSCSSDTRSKNGESRTYEMTSVAIADPDALAYRQHRTDVPENVWAYLVYVPVRDSLVVFTTFASVPEPMPTQFLDALVAAVRAKA